MKNQFLLIILITSLYTCTVVEKDQSNQLPILNPDKVKIEKEFFLSELATKGELIELETNEQTFVKSVTGYYVGKNFIIIADNNIPRVSIYDRQGHFKYNIGAFGKGPGEFSRLVEFCVNEDSGLIYFYSPNTYRISVYKLSGELVKDFNAAKLCNFPVIDALECIGNNIVFVLRRPPYEFKDFYQVWFFDENLNFLDKKKPIPANEMAGYDMQMPVYSEGFDGGLLYFDFFDDTVFFINENREVEPFLQLNYGRMPTEMAQKKGVFDKRLDYTEIGGFYGIHPYLIFTFFQRTKSSKIVYNVQTQEMENLKGTECPTQLTSYGFYNELTCLNPYIGGTLFPDDIRVRVIQRWIIDGYVKVECIEKMSNKYPAQMKRYMEVFSPDKLDQNPVIEIIYMR